ncbi:MAG: hypothetical protein QXS24_03750 [Desulfurococcaceae archaeon]
MMKSMYAVLSAKCKLKTWFSFSRILIHVVFTVVFIIASTCSPSNASTMYLDQPITRDKLCNFIVSLYRDMGGYGCCVESPVVENDVCYTSTNFLAEYVLRSVCGRVDLADKINLFLNKYPSDFYDYYQVLFSRKIELPFTVVEQVQVDAVNNIRIFHVKRTNITMNDYDNYANLIALKAIYHIVSNEKGEALAELDKLNKLFDGYGFADSYYRKHGKYEVYKVALAVLLHKILGYTAEAEKYAGVLFSIDPFTTLYEPGFKGVGDLNLETAALTAIALYSSISTRNEIQQDKTSYGYGIITTLIIIALFTIIITSIKLTMIKKRVSRRGNCFTDNKTMICSSKAA